MRDWAVEILRCLKCDENRLMLKDSSIECQNCNEQYSIKNEIPDFLGEMNPVPLRERKAVEKLSEIPDAVSKLQKLLTKWDKEELSESDFQQFECLRHAVESRQQLLEVLQNHPLTGGSIVLELGADHCWTSNLFLDRDCRVLAIDITNHLELASRGSDRNLFRMYADMNRLPVRSESVDVVWATSAAHHTWNLELTFRECARVLKPKGSLYFCCEPIPSLLRYHFGKDFGHDEREVGINEMWIRRSDWLKACRKAGLRPSLAYPALDRASISERLRKRKIPEALAPLLLPLLKQLQVSIHLLAKKE